MILTTDLKKTIIVAPHPDDEVLGAGGTLLRRKRDQGAQIAWLIITGISETAGWPAERVAERNAEIEQVAQFFDFDAVYRLDLPPAQLETLPMSEIVGGVSKAFQEFQPEEVLVPHPADVHTDHRIVFDAVASCSKWFRYPSVKQVMAYETLSETDFGLIGLEPFRPNVFVDISQYLDEKMKAMEIYTSEVGDFPFPRSYEAMRALAMMRGAASGYLAAEAFQLLRSRD
ncbi:PIG-L deacetylase family protein [Cohaesibacter gelatinilyticus]|uniref:N-acetylglucosaminyl deacetylase, LmbE family n=1 Tax=Cohaesibacter gelatinilyticus TaxID=372072 RepID=A0A285PFU3_9HYPH|nr:PIG-L deacetylase family protein [Cohaesibacter gelatinilyticus]SNZ20127.1 N-acetylglucosaminyl deacetylase, LmbE family [Cohaesibacter gelatinilyticus]